MDCVQDVRDACYDRGSFLRQKKTCLTDLTLKPPNIVGSTNKWLLVLLYLSHRNVASSFLFRVSKNSNCGVSYRGLQGRSFRKVLVHPCRSMRHVKSMDCCFFAYKIKTDNRGKFQQERGRFRRFPVQKGRGQRILHGGVHTAAPQYGRLGYLRGRRREACVGLRYWE